MQMCSKVRSHFGVELPLSFFYQNPTIQGIGSFMAGAPCGTEVPWGVWEHYRNHGSQPPLIGFAQIGAIAKHLASEFPFHVLNHRVDFTARVPPFYPSQTVEEVAQQHLNYLRALRPKGPYLLLGYCFGGLIAYEVARRLTEEGEDVPFLGLIESRPAANIPSMATVARAEVEPVHDSSDGSPPEVIFERQMLQVIREMLLKYKPLPYGGKVWLFHGSDWVGADGWVRLARGGVTACVVPGTHDSIIKEPCVLEFADKLNAGLREAIHNAKP